MTTDIPQDMLLEVKDLQVHFDVRDGIIQAVDGVNYSIRRGQTLGVIGESGCGKSVTARAIMGMISKPGKIVGGEILFHMSENGQRKTINMVDLHPDGEQIRKIRGGHIGMIFQEPMSSLTPVYTSGFHIGEAVGLHSSLTPTRTIGAQMAETIQEKRGASKKEAREIAIEMLQKVGLPKPKERVDSYPHQLSGGQRQRVMIAIALSCQPDLLIADEPTTALDVSIEAQILDLMKHLQQEFGMAIIFITHNLGVVAEMADEIMVMYMGKEVERAPTIELFENPKHPYTQALLHAIPRIGAKKEKLYVVKGMVPDPFNLPHGCVFHTRCPFAMPGKCDVVVPEYGEVAEGHYTRCLLYDESWPQTDEGQMLKEADGGIPNRLPMEEVIND
jgi:peptide/nickel transport system ATP-binding protein